MNWTAAIAIILLTASSSAYAHPRVDPVRGGARQVRAEAFVGEPKARIRSDLGHQGLDPLAFAKWVAAHPALANGTTAKLRRTSNRTALLNLISPMFADADENGDGRIAGSELADFVAVQPRLRVDGRIA